MVAVIQRCSKSSVKVDNEIIARIESLILNKGLKDALKRADAYSRAGANMIMIHSKKKSPREILAFAKKFRKSKYFKPLVAVPSTYSSVKEKQLSQNGFKIVIYANHMLRASYPAMLDVAKNILIHKRSKEVEKKIISINDILNLIK